MADMEELKRKSAEAKARKLAEKGGGAPAPSAPAASAEVDDAAASYADAEKTGKIPAHLLARSAAAKESGASGDASTGGGVAVLDKPTAGAVAAAAALAQPAGSGLAGPAGHTQRLLTVVKAGSIQDVKATPTDKEIGRAHV